MENTNGDFGLYGLIYRNAMSYKNISFDTNISDDVNKKVIDLIMDLQSIESKDISEIKFSDVIYEISPEVDIKSGVIKFCYKPRFSNKINENISDYIDRFKNFNVDDLPLIDVARLLRIKVEKSNIIDVFGKYIPNENKIILGTDYVPTFIHELSHAIDFHLSDYIYERDYSELVAETSTILLCKIYNIPINISNSISYLDSYSSLEINAKKMICRVSEIVECIKIIKENIN